MSGPYQRRDLSNCVAVRLCVLLIGIISCGVLSVNVDVSKKVNKFFY